MNTDGVGNGGERMVAGMNDWGYFAHLSIYRFFSDFVSGKEILEIGSGTGYGANYLSNSASRIVSLDVDATANAFCRAHAASERIDFRLHDLSQSALEGESFDLIVSSNAMEHIPPIDQLLANSTKMLRPGGMFLIAVPPVTSPNAFAENFRNIFHINNITPFNWYTKLSRFYREVRCFRHWVAPTFEGPDRMPIGMSLSPEETTIREADFVFQEMSPEDLNGEDYCITAVFIVRDPRETFLPPSLDEEVPRDWHTGALCSRIMQEEVAKLSPHIEWYKSELVRLEAYAAEQVAIIRRTSAEPLRTADIDWYKAELKRVETYAAEQVSSIQHISAQLHASNLELQRLNSRFVIRALRKLSRMSPFRKSPVQ